MVIQDVDSRIGFGCFWGEVQTAIHKALGCRGLVTDGGVRDLDAVAPGFQVLCGKVTPSHAWVHAIAFGGTVDVFGMVARSDDLIHADRHGAVVIPHEVAREVAGAAELCARREAPIPQGGAQPRFLARSPRARHGRSRGDSLSRVVAQVDRGFGPPARATVPIRAPESVAPSERRRVLRF